MNPYQHTVKEGKSNFVEVPGVSCCSIRIRRPVVKEGTTEDPVFNYSYMDFSRSLSKQRCNSVEAWANSFSPEVKHFPPAYNSSKKSRFLLQCRFLFSVDSSLSLLIVTSQRTPSLIYPTDLAWQSIHDAAS